jgi:glycosyltransferase involved in cell wall biosynthesis
MRILHIISRMDPAGGGPQEVVRLLLRYAPAGCAQEIVTLDDPAAAFLKNETATIHALGAPDKGFAAPQLTRWLRANRDRFDGIILHGLWEYASFAVLRAVAGHIPYVVFPHGMLDPYFKRAAPLKHLKKWLYWLPVQYWTLRRAHRVLFTTAAERDLAALSFWLHRWRPAVVALGAEAPPTNLSTCAAAFYERCPAVRAKRFLLFLGRIDPKKGCDLLIDAFSALDLAAMHVLDLHLVIAGPDPGNWGEQLRTTAQTGGIAHLVHFPGMLTGDAKWGAFAACEGFILPSHQENFGIAVVEALACGKPVLITHPVNISADLAADGCALVEDDTLEGTKDLLTRWLQLTPEERRNIGERARNAFATRYDMRMNARAILRCFDGLTDTAAPEAEA